MKKILVLAILLCLGGLLFAQNDSTIDLGIGFQYGLAKVFDDGKTIREIYEPGLLGTIRFNLGTVGLFGRVGLLFPSKVTEGGLTLDYSSYDYILFANAGLGATFKMPINSRLAFILDIGMSINDLFYGGSYTDTIDASWTIKIENLGQTYHYGNTFYNVKMRDKYNDWAFGILGNVALRFKMTDMISLELGAAVSYDFLRYRSYKFVADFSQATVNGYSIPATNGTYLTDTFAGGALDGDELTLESDGNFSIIKQFTFIPSISVVFSF